MNGTRPSRRNFLRSVLAVSAGAHLGCRSAQGQQTDTGVETTTQTVASGSRAAVATVNPLASRAAISAFDRGGNAFDAAVAASLMLSVVDGQNSGLGGGGLALLRSADGTLVAIDGREKAPQLASPEMFYKNGKPDGALSQTGPLAAGVPGLLATLSEISDRYGKLDWQAALEEAADVAEEGFIVSPSYASRLKSASALLSRFPASAKILLDESGNPWRAGDRLRQTDLAQTLRKIADQGVDWFYQGEFAERTSEFMQREGGLLNAKDFSQYNTVHRPAIRSSYRGNSVFGFPPPSSGGIHIAQMLKMLEAHDVAEIFKQSEATGRHLLAEVMKRAMADRAYWLGDADFAEVPRSLLDDDYLHERAATIRLDRATTVDSHGQPPHPQLDLFGKRQHTTHLTTADSEGNVVALTQTINTTFGSKMIVPGTGVVLNNEMDDFSIAPGVPNAFGLLGSKANRVEPGKRPLSSMSPTIVLDSVGQPSLTCGAAGGPKIITSVAQILVRVLDLQHAVGEAVAAPRAHHQWSPNEIVYEQALASEVAEQLHAMGHTMRSVSSAARAQAIHFDEQALTAAADPRVESSAMAF